MKGCRGGMPRIANAYPNRGIAPSKFDFLNSQSPQRGGCGGAGMCGLHQSGGGSGIPYPDGLIGRPYGSALEDLPGIDMVQGNRNFYSPNSYNNSLSTSMTYTGANRPFSIGGRKKRDRSKRRRKRTCRSRQKGGFIGLTNTIGQDLVNMGREIGYGVHTTVNRFAGTQPGPNPLPWIQPNTTGSSGVNW